MVSLDEIQHARSMSKVSAERLLKERKHFLQSVMVSVAVSKLGKTDLVLIVQPGAKINSVYYCKNVLKQGLLPAIRRVSNNDFVFQQDGAPAHRSHHTVAYLRSNAPEFIEPENWPQYSPDLNTADYSVWRRCSRWCNVTKFKTLIRRSKFWAQLSQDTLNRWLISCRRNWGWLSRQRVVMLNFV